NHVRVGIVPFGIEDHVCQHMTDRDLLQDNRGPRLDLERAGVYPGDILEVEFADIDLHRTVVVEGEHGQPGCRPGGSTDGAAVREGRGSSSLEDSGTVRPGADVECPVVGDSGRVEQPYTEPSPHPPVPVDRPLVVQGPALLTDV